MHKEQHNYQKPFSAQVNTIIHLGAGSCNELDDYLVERPAHLLLIEADRQLADALEIRTAGYPQVEVINRAVASQSGPVTFHRYNLPDVSSLRRASSSLLELFPGLKATQDLQMEAVDPSALLQPMQLDVDQPNWLVIDLPGEELPVLKVLQQDGLLHFFDQLKLYCSHQSLYEESEPAAIIIQWLQDQGFDLLAEEESHDPDRPCWTLKRNKLQLQYRELKQQLVKLMQANDKQEKLINERQIQVEQLTKARDEQAKLVAVHKAQLEKVNQDKSDQVKLVNEHQAQIEQLTKARDEQAKLVAVHKAQLEKVNQAKSDQENLVNGRQAQIEQLTKARDEQAKIVAEYKAQLEKVKQAKSDQEKRVNERQAQIEKLTKARDKQAKLVVEHKTQLEKVNQVKTNQEKLVNDRQAQIEQLTKARDEQARLAVEHKAQLETANQGKTNQEKLANDRQIQIEKLEQQLAELNQRQPMLDDEFVKAEAQIELIKDILIREKAF